MSFQTQLFSVSHKPTVRSLLTSNLLVAGILLAITLLTSTALAGQKIVVVVDDSGSMADRMRFEPVRKMEAAKKALRVVLERLPEDAEVGVLALNRGWLTPIKALDRQQLRRQVNSFRARGGTPLGMRMKEATDSLLEMRKKDPYGDFRLLVVTDGEASDQAVLDGVLPDIMSRNLVVDVIGVDMQSEHSLATEVTNYRRADDPQSLEAAIAESLAESDDSAVAGGESDFELLAALPVDIAPAVITSLTSINNEPINQMSVGENSPNGSAVFQPTSSSRSRNRGGGFAFGGMFCMLFLFIGVSVISSIFKKIARPTRRRRW